MKTLNFNCVTGLASAEGGGGGGEPSSSSFSVKVG